MKKLMSMWIVMTLAVLLLGMCSGCGAKYTIHPNSIPLAGDGGSFDSHVADYLDGERAFLDSFKGKTEPKAVAEALEYAEKQYTVTKTAYLTWRTTQTAEALQDLNKQKTTLTQAVGQVSSAQAASTGGGK